MGPRSLRYGVVLVAAVAWMAIGRPAQAQEATGVFRGEVTTEAGGAVADARVVAVNEATGAERAALADAAGSYRIEELPPAVYTVRVEALGYRAAERSGVRLGAGETRVLDFSLRPAPIQLEGVAVTSATRTATPVSQLATAVTVVDREEIEDQAAISNDLGAVLGQMVPGLAVSTGTLSNYGQTLRGRRFSVLIDGVPQSTPLRNVLRDLRTIDASAIKRIEVVRGASAIYGYGATGGVVNIITRDPARVDPTFTTEIGMRFQPADPDASAGGRVVQRLAGRLGAVDYVLSGSFEDRGASFDAAGDRIPPDPHGQGGLANTTAYDLLAKLGADLGAAQRVELTVNHFDTHQETQFVTVAGVPGREKTAAERGAVPGLPTGTENTVVALDYTHEDVFGSRLGVKLYHQDYATRFGFSTFFPDGGGQSQLISEKLGARADVRTPVSLLGGGALVWGVDYLDVETAQPLVDGRVYVPPMHQRALGGFVQAELSFGERVLVRGGVRHEAIRLEVDDYETLFAGNEVAGGVLDYGATLFNAGAVVFLTDAVELFGGFSQGFSVADVGRVLRSTEAPSVERLQPEAQEVDSYELGLRLGRRSVSASVTGFYNESALGSTFSDLPELRIVRRPERVYGVESTLDVHAVEGWRFGGTLTWMEGKVDADDDGEFERYLPGYRIPPLKVTGYLEHQTLPGWRNRLQVLYSGSRDRFDGSEVFGEGAVESYATVDFLSTVDVWRGRLQIAVENLLDEQYFPPISQWYNIGFGYTAAPGRTVSVGYSITY